MPDLDKLAKKEIPPEEHLKINSFFTIATAVVSITLAIALYVMFVGRDEAAPWIIYLVFGFLVAMTAWQIQTFIRTRMLKKQIAKLRPSRDEGPEPPLFQPADPSLMLGEGRVHDNVPASVIERTTRNLPSAKSEQ